MYDNYSLRQRIVSSPLTLIVGLLAAVGLWQVPYFEQPDSFYTLGVVLLTAYIMVNVVNSFGLIRQRSRLTTALLFVLLTLVSNTTTWTPYALLPPLLVTVFTCLMATTGERQAEMHIWHAFVALGVMVAIAPLSVVVVAVAYVSLFVHFRTLRFRGLSASVLGLMLPAIGVAVWALFEPIAVKVYLMMHYEQLMALPWLTYNHLTVGMLAVYGCIVLTTLPAMIHVLMDSGENRPQVRGAFGYFVALQVVLLIAASLLPELTMVWWPLLAVNSSPLLAYHLVLSRHPLTDLWFYVVLLLLVAAFLFTRVLWTDWLVFS